ncbi:MAG: hypothetical protein GEU94_17785 [Micromonosporaceae bacterium]|nr:hypothetical protein [Micromonosporaceae bacterium]
MPNTFVGLLLFVVLLIPGFVYVLATERGPRPVRTFSAFQEVSRIAVVSLSANTVVALLFSAAYPMLSPALFPDIANLFTTPQQQIAATPGFLGGWLVGLLLLSCAVALVFAGVVSRGYGARLVRKRPLSWVVPGTGGVYQHSAWWQVFEYEQASGTKKRVVARLSDGGAVEGYIWTYSPLSDETGDRELVLTGPLVFRDKDGKECVEEKGAAILSARNIQSLHIRYEPR